MFKKLTKQIAIITVLVMIVSSVTVFAELSKFDIGYSTSFDDSDISKFSTKVDATDTTSSVSIAATKPGGFPNTDKAVKLVKSAAVAPDKEVYIQYLNQKPVNARTIETSYDFYAENVRFDLNLGNLMLVDDNSKSQALLTPQLRAPANGAAPKFRFNGLSSATQVEYSYNTWYNLWIKAYLDTNTFDARLTLVSDGSLVKEWTGESLRYTSEIKSTYKIDYSRFGGKDSATANESTVLYIDNFGIRTGCEVLSVVPMIGEQAAEEEDGKLSADINKFELTFSEPMIALTTNDVSLVATASQSPVTLGTPVMSADNKKCTVAIEGDLEAGANYTFNVKNSAKNANGVGILDEVEYAFTVAGVQAANEIVSISYLDADNTAISGNYFEMSTDVNKVEITFAGEVNQAFTDTIKLFVGNTEINCTGVLSNGNTVYTMTINDAVTPGTAYNLVVDNKAVTAFITQYDNSDVTSIVLPLEDFTDFAPVSNVLDYQNGATSTNKTYPYVPNNTVLEFTEGNAGAYLRQKLASELTAGVYAVEISIKNEGKTNVQTPILTNGGGSSLANIAFKSDGSITLGKGGNIGSTNVGTYNEDFWYTVKAVYFVDGDDVTKSYGTFYVNNQYVGKVGYQNANSNVGRVYFKYQGGDANDKLYLDNFRITKLDDGLKVKNMSFVDADGKDVNESFAGVEKLGASVKLVNHTSSAATPLVMLALYRDSQLLDMRLIHNEEFEVGEELVLPIEKIDLPNDMTGVHAKVMVFESLASLSPVCVPVKLPQQ